MYVFTCMNGVHMYMLNTPQCMEFRISPVQVPVPDVQLFLRIRNALSAAAASENLENLPKLDKDRLQALR